MIPETFARVLVPAYVSSEISQQLINAVCTEVIWASSINSPRTLANKIRGEQNLKFLFVSVKYFLYSLLLVICCCEEMMMTGDWMMTGSWPRVPFPVANLMPELFHFLSWDCCEQFCVKRERLTQFWLARHLEMDQSEQPMWHVTLVSQSEQPTWQVPM